MSTLNHLFWSPSLNGKYKLFKGVIHLPGKVCPSYRAEKLYMYVVLWTWTLDFVPGPSFSINPILTNAWINASYVKINLLNNHFSVAITEESLGLVVSGSGR